MIAGKASAATDTRRVKMSEDPNAADVRPGQNGPQTQGGPQDLDATAPLPQQACAPQHAQGPAEHWMWSRQGQPGPAPQDHGQQQQQHMPGFTPWHAPAPGAEPASFHRVPAKERGGSGRALGLTALVAVFASGVGAVGGAGLVYALDHRAAAHSALANGADCGPFGSKGVPAAVDGRPMSVAEVAALVQPEVVQIEVNVPDGHITGSGVILSADGKILTNNHVVSEAASGGAVMQVHLHDGATLPASVVATDPDTDLAVIQAKGRTDLPVAKLGSSADLTVGQDVVAIGSPMGLEGTVTRGIVSALRRPVAAGGEDGGAKTSALEAIQTDASINPGNSGGALVNMQGQVVGINFMIYTLGSDRQGQSGSIGLGFAIPIDLAKHVADQLIQNGKATHASLGVTVRGTDPSASVRGVSVLSVNSGSGAEAAGISVGSVITKVDGRPIDGTVGLVAVVRGHSPGEKIRVTYIDGASDGAERTVPVTLGMA